jgi:hypothetical protein
VYEALSYYYIYRLSEDTNQIVVVVDKMYEALSY